MSEVNTPIDTAPAVNQPTNDVVSTAVPAVPGASSIELRKALRELRHGHASDGASARAYPVPEGREALPLASARAREHICSFQPLTAAQNTFMRKYARSLTEQEVTLTDGTTCVLKLKPSTYEEMLALGSYTEVLKSACRPLFSECLLDYEIAPAGLTAATRQRAHQLLESLGATHILAWAKDQELPVYQDLAQEIVAAWDDPKIAGLTCCTGDIPLKPKVKQVQPFVQGLAERAAHWPESLRPLLADLIKVLTHCVASKLHDYLVMLQPLLQLSSSDLHAALLKLAQKLPPFCSFLALVHPVEWEQSGRNLHKFLQATTIKLKKTALRKRSTKRVKSQPQAQASAAVAVPEPSLAQPLAAEPTINAAAPSATAVSAVPEVVGPEVITTAAALAEVPVDEISSAAIPASEADSAETSAEVATEVVADVAGAAPNAADSLLEAAEAASDEVSDPVVDANNAEAPEVAAAEVVVPTAADSASEAALETDVAAPTVEADTAEACEVANEAEVPASAAADSAVSVFESSVLAEAQATDGGALAEPPRAEVEVAEAQVAAAEVVAAQVAAADAAAAGASALSCKAKINALADKVCTLVEKVVAATEDDANGLAPEDKAALRQAALASIQTQARVELGRISQEQEQADQRAWEQYQKHLKRSQHKRERQLRKQARRHRK